ncbi:unnamed protein product [Phaeothamnion confervicola]
MAELMVAADCIVTKAGTSTLCEAAASGLPVLLSSHLPGQEAGNVPFVVDGGFGAFCARPADVAAAISGWLRDPAALQAMGAAARAAVDGGAALSVAGWAGELLHLGERDRGKVAGEAAAPPRAAAAVVVGAAAVTVAAPAVDAGAVVGREAGAAAVAKSAECFATTATDTKPLRELLINETAGAAADATTAAAMAQAQLMASFPGRAPAGILKRRARSVAVGA